MAALLNILRPIMGSTLRPVALSLLTGIYLTGCPKDDTNDDSADDQSGAEHGADEHGADEHGGAEHGADEHGGAEHGGDEHGDHDHSVDTSADDPAVIYCSCMLAHCHEPYHGKWGEDEMAAEQACLMEADSLPMNGGDVDMGDFIECRQHYCDMAADDPSVCTNALGDAVCM